MSSVMGGKLIILGTGTCQIQGSTAASSVLLELGDTRLVYDFGRGITQRLGELGLKQDDLRDIVISHFHPDHVSDLIPFLHAASWSKIDPRKAELNIYGPSGIQSFFERLADLFKPDELVRSTYKVSVHEITEDRFATGEQVFDFVELPPANNHGLKFIFNNKTYALTGDSHFHLQEINFLKLVDLAVIDSGHITDGEIVELAVKSQAKMIVCSHQYRELKEKELNRQARDFGYHGRVVVAEDLMSFDL